MRVLRWLFAIAVLPGTVLVFVPLAILGSTTGADGTIEIAPLGSPRLWASAALGAVGLALALWAQALFARFGDGTAAPWDPPRRFVVRGPYRHVRNPMILGVLFLLLSEAALFRSWPIAVWALVFGAGNVVYFPWVEERGLERRFGEPYRVYREHVPRWIPRLRPWRPPEDGGEGS